MFWRKLFKIIKNKYLIVTVLFITWMLFFDSNNVFTLLKYKNELQKVRQTKSELQAKITENETLLQKLKYDRKELMNFAREEYFMKKDNEDVFLIVTQQKK